MAIDPEVISPSSKKASKLGQYIPKWVFYSAGGLGVFVLVGLIKALLPVIGMAFLLAFIWSQSTTTKKYWEICSPRIQAFFERPLDELSSDNEMVNGWDCPIEDVNYKD